MDLLPKHNQNYSHISGKCTLFRAYKASEMKKEAFKTEKECFISIFVACRYSIQDKVKLVSDRSKDKCGNFLQMRKMSVFYC